MRIMASVYAAEPAAPAQPPPAAPAASSQAEQSVPQAGHSSAAAQQPVREQEEALPLPRLHRAAAAGDADKVPRAQPPVSSLACQALVEDAARCTACRCAGRMVCRRHGKLHLWLSCLSGGAVKSLLMCGCTAHCRSGTCWRAGRTRRSATPAAGRPTCWPQTRLCGTPSAGEPEPQPPGRQAVMAYNLLCG